MDLSEKALSKALEMMRNTPESRPSQPEHAMEISNIANQMSDGSDVLFEARDGQLAASGSDL